MASRKPAKDAGSARRSRGIRQRPIHLERQIREVRASLGVSDARGRTRIHRTTPLEKVEEAASERRSELLPARRKERQSQRRSSLDRALEALEEIVLAQNPGVTGKVVLSFTVGPGGRPREVSVIGLDQTLDHQLARRLRLARLATRYAGYQLQTKLIFRRGKVTRR